MKNAPHFLVLVCVMLYCQRSVILAKKAPLFRYYAVASKTAGFCFPVVNESVIAYDNSSTDQHYRSVDKKRTEDALFRDFKYCVKKNGLQWTELTDSVSLPLRRAMAGKRCFIDSLPLSGIRLLINAKIDLVVMIYDVRLSHVQSVDVDATRGAPFPGYGSFIRRTLSFKCSIIDVTGNKPLYCKEIRKEAAGEQLDLIEKSFKELFHDILR